MEYESDHNDKEQKAGRVLEHYIRNYKIFIDTCSILHPNVDKFWENIMQHSQVNGHIFKHNFMKRQSYSCLSK